MVADQPGRVAEFCLTSNLCVFHQGRADGGHWDGSRTGKYAQLTYRGITELADTRR
jgi:hypothetical protein